MSESEPVTRREFDIYREHQRDVQKGNEREQRSLRRDIEAGEARHQADMERLAAQREEDRTAADVKAQHKSEWSWQTKLAVAGLALVVAGWWVNALLSHK